MALAVTSPTVAISNGRVTPTPTTFRLSNLDALHIAPWIKLGVVEQIEFGGGRGRSNLYRLTGKDPRPILDALRNA